MVDYTILAGRTPLRSKERNCVVATPFSCSRHKWKQRSYCCDVMCCAGAENSSKIPVKLQRILPGRAAPGLGRPPRRSRLAMRRRRCLRHEPYPRPPDPAPGALSSSTGPGPPSLDRSVPRPRGWIENINRGIIVFGGGRASGGGRRGGRDRDLVYFQRERKECRRSHTRPTPAEPRTVNTRCHF